MTNSKLSDRGWKPQEVEPGNCLEKKWLREGTDIHAVITEDKDGTVKGMVKAASELATAKKRGELLLNELESPEAAATVLETLMAQLEAKAPHLEEEDRLFLRKVSSV